MIKKLKKLTLQRVDVIKKITATSMKKLIGLTNLLPKLLLQKDVQDNLIKEYSQNLLRQLSSLRQASRIHNIRAEKVFRHVEDGSFLMGMEMVSDVDSKRKNTYH